ncbi:unnamed protein product [Meloidogyne enterolobii]|uniref:Uncharacterized protein n=1 Tax=Meloidogyne enterolobii TaxID=390850 RepID=A0ACB1APR4_MELEN
MKKNKMRNTKLFAPKNARMRKMRNAKERKSPALVYMGPKRSVTKTGSKRNREYLKSSASYEEEYQNLGVS